MYRRSIWVSTVFLALAGCGGQESGQSELSVDGLLFTARRGGVSDLYLQSGDAAPTNLTRGSTTDNWGVWSPAGDRIAFQSQRDGNYEIYLMDPESGDVSNWSLDPGHDGLPVWSPDGRRIAFFSNRGLPPSEGGLPGHIYIADASGGDPVRATLEPLSTPLGPSAWSLDGRRIYFSRITATGSAVVALDVASGREERLLESVATVGVGDLSPDGTTLAAYVDSGDDARIALLALDAEAPALEMVTAAGAWAYYPSWSPDGGWIVYTRMTEDQDLNVEAVHLTTGDVAEVVVTSEIESEASPRPRAGR